MTRKTSVSLTALPTALLAAGLVLAGCSSDNEPSVANGDMGDSGGNDATSNNASNGSGGTSSGSESSNDTTDSSSGTSSSTDGSSGGSSSGAESTATTSPSGVLGDPVCTHNLAGDEIKKGTACTDEDVELCYRSCGPQSVGWKTEICTAGAYAEGDCEFPIADDYSCFAIPEVLNESCPEEAPQASEECDVDECTPCNAAGEYLDSSGNVKSGYCVCQPANSAGTRTWTCASSTAWPCPSGNGCT